MQKLFLMGALTSLFFVACATTPDSVKLASQMQAQTIQIVQENTFNVLEAHNDEVKAATLNRYAAEFSRAEEAMKDAEGRVPLDMYKQVATDFAREVEKAQAYYDTQLGNFKTKLLYQFTVAGRLNDSIIAYQNVKSFTPEDAKDLIDGLSDLATSTVKAAQTPEQPKPETSLEDILNIIRERSEE